MSDIPPVLVCAGCEHVGRLRFQIGEHSVIALFLFSERGLSTAVFAFELGAGMSLLVYAAVLLKITSRDRTVGKH